jgi:nucleotide-binding universal stress UspA family protein
VSAAAEGLGSGRILVGTNGSPQSEVAVGQGARLASLTGSSLSLMFVLDKGHPHEGEAELEAERVLRRGTEIANTFGVDVEQLTVAGDPAQALVRESSELGVELICVGADTGLLDKPHKIGRVAAHVVQLAGSSVLVARGTFERFPSRVLCGVDGSESSGMTADVAAQVAALADAEFHLIHVIPVFRGGNEEWEVGPDEPVPPELEPALDRARARGVQPVLEMAMGRPENALVEVARRDAADLVVVGHRGISGIQRLLLGSVGEHVTSHAPCSVLVVRPERHAGSSG